MVVSGCARRVASGSLGVRRLRCQRPASVGDLAERDFAVCDFAARDLAACDPTRCTFGRDSLERDFAARESERDLEACRGVTRA